MKFKVSSCPHCGGTGGVLTTMRFKAVRFSDWDGQAVSTENYEVLSETDPRCADCQKAVRGSVDHSAPGTGNDMETS